MKTNYIIIILLLLGLLYAGTLSWDSDLVFSHKYHVQEVGAECSDCHSKAQESTSGKDDLLPEMETCYTCHDEEMACTACHKQGEEPLLLPRITLYNSEFNHSLHQKKNISCLSCHRGVDTKEKVTSGIHLPDGKICSDCHSASTQLTQKLKPRDHSEFWLQIHGTFSETGSQNCSSCHTDAYCIDCHQGENLLNQSHPAEFIATHGISYTLRESDCAGCHQGKDYCIECHREVNNVSPSTHLMPDWKGPLHSQEARKDFDYCSVCHTQDDIACIECHN
jgi:hypothetical protein